jgi:long-chain acyl-CoA synthetase
MTDQKFEHIHQYCQFLANEHGTKTVFSYLDGDEFTKIQYRELTDQSFKISRFFTATQFASKKIAVLSESSPEFVSLMLGSLLVGNTLVPIDIRLSPKEISNILDHAQVDAIAHSEQTESLLADVLNYTSIKPKKISLKGADSIKTLPDYKPVKLTAPNPDAAAFLIYTSGTFGKPKGVVVTMSSILFQVNCLAKHLKTERDEIFLSFLPVNHLFALTTDFFINFANGSELCIASSLEKEHLFRCIHGRNVTQMITVPLFLRSLKKGIMTGVNSGSLVKKLAFNTMFFIAQFLPNFETRRALFKGLYKKLGPGLFRAVTGGAPLGKELAEWFSRIGFEVYEGYGLSETGPVISVNTTSESRLGSTGKPIENIEVYIDGPNEDGVGEVLTKGPHLMSGYYNNEELTGQVFKDGFFRTGDLGLIDEDGYLFIKGRAKRLIVLDGGKKVHAEELENYFSQNERFQDVCIMGKRQVKGFEESELEEVILVVTPNPEYYEKFDDSVQSQLAEQAKQMYPELTSYKTPSQLIVLPEQLPKTTTMKVKVLEVAAQIGELIN